MKKTANLSRGRGNKKKQVSKGHGKSGGSQKKSQKEHHGTAGEPDKDGGDPVVCHSLVCSMFWGAVVGGHRFGGWPLKVAVLLLSNVQTALD